jgi:hypothetical protein
MGEDGEIACTNTLDAVDIDTCTHIGIGCKFSNVLRASLLVVHILGLGVKSISTSWAPSYHATLTSCIQFSALGEKFVLNIEPYPTISCELVLLQENGTKT